MITPSTVDIWSTVRFASRLLSAGSRLASVNPPVFSRSPSAAIASVICFWLALIFQLFFAQRLRLLPVAGQYDPNLVFTHPLVARTQLPVVDAPPWYDVDDAASLRMLEDELSGETPAFLTIPGAEAPSTRLFLRQRQMSLADPAA